MTNSLTIRLRSNQSSLAHALIRTEKNYIAYVAFNTKRFPTDDFAVRRALGEAVDPAEIASKVYHGLWPVATTEIAPMLWAHDPSVRPYAHDPAAAAHDLDAAGWRLSGPVRTKGRRSLSIDVAYYGPSPQSRGQYLKEPFVI